MKFEAFINKIEDCKWEVHGVEIYAGHKRIVAAANALEENLYGYLQKNLFEPKCPDGYFYGASGMELTVNELSRIGVLLMDNGLYQEKRIVSESYIKNACSVQQMNREGSYGFFVWKYHDGYRRKSCSI